MKRLVLLLLVTVLLSTTAMALADLPSWVQQKLEYTLVGEGNDGYWNLGSVYGPFSAGIHTWTTGGNATTPSLTESDSAIEPVVEYSERKKLGENQIPTSIVREIHERWDTYYGFYPDNIVVVLRTNNEVL